MTLSTSAVAASRCRASRNLWVSLAISARASTAEAALRRTGLVAVLVAVFPARVAEAFFAFTGEPPRLEPLLARRFLVGARPMFVPSDGTHGIGLAGESKGTENGTM